MRNVTDNLFYETSPVLSSFVADSICMFDIEYLLKLDDRIGFHTFVNSLKKFNLDYIKSFSFIYSPDSDSYTIGFDYKDFLRPSQFRVLSRYGGSLYSYNNESCITYAIIF